MSINDCDTKEGIAARLGSYAELKALLDERFELGHAGEKPGGRSGQLNTFIVLGRFQIDGYGQIWRLSPHNFTDADRAQLPAVMTQKELDEYCAARAKESWSAGAVSLPPAHIFCAHCHGSWELATCHEIESSDEFEKVDLSPYAGKTLKEAVAELAKSVSDRRYASLGDPPSMWSQKWVTKNRRLMQTEQEGWRSANSVVNPITWDYVVEAGDHASVFVYRYYHGNCAQQLAQKQFADELAETQKGLQELLDLAGFTEIVVTLTPLPQHLRDWISKEEESPEEAEKAAKEIIYFSIETKQGQFGICRMAYPMIDLHGTGVEVKELVPELEDQVLEDFPPMVGLAPELEQIAKFRQLLEKKHSVK